MESDSLGNRVVASWEAFATALVTSTAAEAPPLVRILRQKKLKAHLDKKPLIVLVTAQRAGAYYTKKNLWTFFGGPPLYTAGATSLVYMVVETETDGILASGSVAKHGGYRSIRAVGDEFK